jgi:hypothetical protein
MMDALAPTEPKAPGQSAAVALFRPKVAALCYDRVWGMSPEMPGSIRFSGGTNFEIEMLVRHHLLLETSMLRKQDVRFRHGLEAQYRAFGEGLAATLAKTGEQPSSPLAGGLTRAVAKHVDAVSIYTSGRQLSEEYEQGDHAAALVTAANVSMVDENSLTWEQVLEFREDTEARLAYRQYVHALDAEMLGKPLSYIQDEMAIRLEKHDKALRDHGISPLSGVISGLLDAKNIGVVSGASATAGKLDGGIGALLTAGILMIGKAIVEVRKHRVAREDLKRGGDSGIAWAYEAKKKLGQGAGKDD